MGAERVFAFEVLHPVSANTVFSHSLMRCTAEIRPSAEPCPKEPVEHELQRSEYHLAPGLGKVRHPNKQISAAIPISRAMSSG